MIKGVLLHSVSYAGLWGQASLSVDDFLAKAAALGYDGVMLMAKRPHVSVLDYDAAARARLRARIADLGLKHVLLAGYTNLTADLEHGEIPHREIQIHYMTELARLASDIGASAVRVFTGYESAVADYSRQWRLIVDTLREAAHRAAEFGVVLGVQNHHDMAVGWESYRDLLREVNEPACRAMFDAWAPALQGADLKASAAELAPLSVNTTIADYQLRPRYKYNAALINYEAHTPAVVAVPMGEGFIDYEAFLGASLANGFEGTVTYEMCSPLVDGGSAETLERYARRFLDWVRPYR